MKKPLFPASCPLNQMIAWKHPIQTETPQPQQLPPRRLVGQRIFCKQSQYDHPTELPWWIASLRSSVLYTECFFSLARHVQGSIFFVGPGSATSQARIRLKTVQRIHFRFARIWRLKKRTSKGFSWNPFLQNCQVIVGSYSNAFQPHLYKFTDSIMY